MLLKECPSAADALGGAGAALWGGVGVGSSQEGLVVVGYGNEQHPSPLPPRAQSS